MLPVGGSQRMSRRESAFKRKDSSGLGAGESMALGQSHDQRFLQQWMEDDASSLTICNRLKAASSRSLSTCSISSPALPWAKRHAHPRKGLAELADDARYQRMKCGRTRKCYRDSAFLASRCAPCGFKRAIEVGEGRTGAIKERAAGVRQLNAARHAAEQLYLDFLLDRLDEAAEWWLLQCQAVPPRG